MLDAALAACADLDVTLLYATTAAPFDAGTLAANCPSGKVLLCEPCFGGALAADVLRAVFPRPVTVDLAGQDAEFSRNYGSAREHDAALGLDAAGIRGRLERLVHAA
jgi:transketolase